MGKSDPYIFKEYLDVLSGVTSTSTAFLGFKGENDFTRKIPGVTRHFYDLALGNWEINSDWSLKQKYDLIVCTRCAYFSKEPDSFVSKCKNSISPLGHALIDWGLGDHWRFKKYKVGWVKDGEHEYGYEPSNKLYSCFWTSQLENNQDVRMFLSAIRNKGYSADQTLTSIISNEVPKVVEYKTKIIKLKFLWPEDPQLYIITLVGPNNV